MSAPDIDKRIMQRFAPLAQGAHLTIVLGAGASAPSGLPDWDCFTQRVVTLSGLVSTEDAARVLLSKQDQTIALEAARDRAGDQWHQHLVTALYGSLADHPEPSSLHLAAARHYLGDPKNTTLATLNYDVLLERAIADSVETEANALAVPIAGIDGTVDPHRPTVHHLHGVVDCEGVHDPIVGFRDYAELTTDEGAWQRTFLSRSLRDGPLLLAGTSYRDPDIRQWLHLILRDEKPRHPAIVAFARQGLGLDREQFDTIHTALEAEWSSIGLEALHMQDLSDIARVVRELQHVRRPDYRTPAERAAQVWTSHRRRFATLQTEYSDALSMDSRTIATSLRTRAFRASLWLADGQGKLARWATDGSTFRTVSSLKRVPTGHDSPWIAGEAIGSEDVKVKDVERDRRVSPTWKAVVAIPVFVGDGQLPDLATAVLTFGLTRSARSLLENDKPLKDVAQRLSSEWGNRLSEVAFSQTRG